MRHFPYIDDLGRLASLLSLPPWQEPVVQDGGGSASPETVETYRQRIARIVALYTNGLGTIEAMRRMTEAQLPVDVDAAPEQRDRPFDVEELAPLLTVNAAVRLEGQPTDFVGPLMHWPLVNDARRAVAADGVPPGPDRGRARRGRPGRRAALRARGLARARALPRRRRSGSGSPTATRFRPARRSASVRPSRRGSGSTRGSPVRRRCPATTTPTRPLRAHGRRRRRARKRR